MFVFIAAVVHLSVHFMRVLFYGDVLQICELLYHLRGTVSAMPWCSKRDREVLRECDWMVLMTTLKFK